MKYDEIREEVRLELIICREVFKLLLQEEIYCPQSHANIRCLNVSYRSYFFIIFHYDLFIFKVYTLKTCIKVR